MVWSEHRIADPQPPSTEPPIQRRRLAVSALGHAISDGLVNLVPPLWYVVRTMFSLGNRQLGLLMMVSVLFTNFGQPVFGYLTDRFRWRNVVGLGVFISVVFTCAVGFMPNVWLFGAALVLAGTGTALFHPQGGGLAAHASGRRRAFGMSIFGLGGALGYALGSLAGPVLHRAGLAVGMGSLQGFVFVLPLGLVLAYILHAFTRNHGMPAPKTRFHLRIHLLPHWKKLAPVFVVMVLRAMAVVAYASFYQVFVGEQGRSVYHQGVALFSFVFGGAVGGMLGARFSELWGARFITVATMLVSPPLLYYTLYIPYLAAVGLLFVAGLMVRGAEPVNIAQTQDLVPNGISMASSIAMGLTWGLAGVVTPLVGWVSDATGNLAYAMALTAFLPIAGAAVALALPASSSVDSQADAP